MSMAPQKLGSIPPNTQGQGQTGSAQTTGEQPKPFLQEVKDQRIKTAVRLGGLGLAALFTGGVFKDGIKEGLKRTSQISSSISNVFSVFASTVFFPLTLAMEFLTSKNKTMSKSDPNNALYSLFSLAFAPNTFSTPLAMGARSTPHLIAALLNSIHTGFTLLSYTGGRLLSCLKGIQLARTDENDKQRYRLEQEFESLFTLGNVGSAQASVIPMAGQFITGWETITDLFKGNFGSIWDRFKKEPLSVTLGTFFNSWMWPFEYISKILDTTIRTAEMTPQIEHAFEGGEKNWLINFLNKKIKEPWHNAVKNPNSFVGSILKKGRNFSKMWSLVGPPVGMTSIVLCSTQRFLKGHFWNKEAQEIGGLVGSADKAFNILAMLSHAFYLPVYALFVRGPQLITSSTFYATNFINKYIKGIDTSKEGYENEPGYIDPNVVRDKIFNRPFINKISDWAEKKLQKLDADIKGNKGRKINSETKESGFLRNFYTAVAQEVIWEPIREKHFEEQVKLKNGVKPSQKDWEAYLSREEENILKEAEPLLIKYLEESVAFDGDQINYCKTRGDWEKILQRVRTLLEEERDTSINEKQDKGEKVEIKSKTFFELILNPRELFEILKARTFHIANTILPLFLRGFVNIVDFGKKGELDFYRNWKATETAIRVGDIEEACKKEYMPVVGYAFSCVGKGLALLWNLFHGRLPSFEAEAA